MHKFIKKCGAVVEGKSFVHGPKLADGYWWSLESELGSDENVWREVPSPHETKGTIFGYEEKAFLARQYK
jgi:hypothetical protein